jgi:hypothetical protein
MNEPERTPEVTRLSGASAGVAGVGSGTLLAALTAQIKNETVRTWVVLAIPTVAFVAGAFWAWIQAGLMRWLQEREVRVLIAQAKDEIQQALANQNTSEQHREELRKQLEQLELVSVQRFKSRLETIPVITMADTTYVRAATQRTPQAGSNSSNS